MKATRVTGDTGANEDCEHISDEGECSLMYVVDDDPKLGYFPKCEGILCLHKNWRGEEE
jgi:hypothetical protein